MINEKKLEAGITMFLEGLGEDITDQHCKDTPKRVARAWKQYFGAGYEMDPKEILKVQFADKYDDMVIVRNIPVQSHCIHHLVSFSGTATVAYIPKGNRVTGLSKLARIVDVFAKRLQIQERLTRQVAEAINDTLQPKGVAVVIKASHMCMTHRGVRAVGSDTVTSCMLGCFRNEPSTRAEFLEFCK